MIVSIQYMRAIAVLLVMFYHATWKGEVYSGTSWDWFNFGIAGVDLFFIISGYIMCYTASRKPTGIYKFMKARFTRIIPLYWTLTLVTLVIYLIVPDKINSTGGDTSILHSFTLLPTDAKYLIQNGWTLSYEFFFYIIFSVGLIFSGTKRHLIPAVILTILAIAGQLLKPDNVYLGFMTNPILIEFVMGIAVFRLMKRYEFPKQIGVALCLSSIFLFAGVSYWGETGDRVIDYGIPCLLLFIGLINLEHELQQNKHNPLSRVMGKVGDSSYSAYLIHPFVLVIASVIFSKLGITNFGNLFIISLVLGSVLTGWICYVALEKPLNKFFRGTSKGGIKGNKEPMLSK